MSRLGGWRLRTQHVTRFRYSSPARASYNEVRKIPLTTSRQTALESRIGTVPHASQYSYWDYWGTQVVAFNVDEAHAQLTVEGTALVETQPPAGRPEASWRDVGEMADRFDELLVASRHTAPDDALRAAASDLRRPSPVDTVEAVVGWTHDSLHYVPGVTSVRTSAGEALRTGRGVCQDFAHLAVAVLRQAGVPARYVSGYLHPERDATVGEPLQAESHAWIEAWTGRWWGLDPTNDVPIGLRHVVVARGRDYADVVPVRGIYAGTAEHEATASVTITRAV